MQRLWRCSCSRAVVVPQFLLRRFRSSAVQLLRRRQCSSSSSSSRCVGVWPAGVAERQRRTAELFDHLAALHALPSGWRLAFDRAKRRCALCDYAKKRISVSSAFLSATARTEAEVENTLLHEMAHALTPGCNHGSEWRATALKIGCDGKRTFVGDAFADPRWLLGCKEGCIAMPRHRRSKLNRRLRCRSCGGSLSFTAVKDRRRSKSYE